jgi:carbon storage regulator
MLVLTRKEGESVIIDGDIEITVRRVQGKAVSLAIKAPKEKRISRGEIAETLHEELTLQG